MPSDNFTGADGTLLGTYSSNWIVKPTPGTILISGNKAVANNIVGYPYDVETAYWNPSTDVAGTNQWAQGTLKFIGGNGLGGLALYLDTVGQGYGVVYSDNSSQAFIIRITDFGGGLSTTSLAADGTQWFDGDVMYFEIDNRVVPGTLTLKRNGTITATVVDTTYTSGQYGLCMIGADANCGIDAWSAGDLGGSSLNIVNIERGIRGFMRGVAGE